MNSIQGVIHWFMYNPLSAAAVFFGAAAAAVTLYTYAHGYYRLKNQG